MNARGRHVARAVVLIVALPATGCFVPPVILPAPTGDLELAEFPAGTEPVELPVAPGISLKGVFVPGPPGAPVLLHFIEAMASITQGAVAFGDMTLDAVPGEVEPSPLDDLPADPAARVTRTQFQLATRCRGLGWSCLIVDYEGVGQSGGERTPDNLRRDARAAWDEAVRRAGGDPRRVVLRGTSIGTLAVGCLLDEGLEPAAVTLVAPVRAETVAVNFSRRAHGEVLTFLAAPFVRDAVDVDLVALLAQADEPLLVISPRYDWLLPPDEAALFRQAVERSGGVFALRQKSHERLALAGRDLISAEVAFYERRLPALVPDREQAAVDVWRDACARSGGSGLAGKPASAFDPGQPLRARLRALLDQVVLPTPGLAIALSLEPPGDEQALLSIADWLAWLPESLWSQADLDVLLALVSFDDPAGRMNASLLTWTIVATATRRGRPVGELLQGFVDLRHHASGEAPFGMSAGIDGTVRPIGARSQLRGCLERERHHLLDVGGLSATDAERQVFRLYLKSVGVSERLSADGLSLEVWDSGTWRPCLIPPPVTGDWT